MNRIADLKRKKFWFEQETGQVYTRFWNTCTTQENSLKQRPGQKKIKTMAYIAPSKGHYPSNG